MRFAPHALLILVGLFGSFFSLLTRKQPKISFSIARLAKEDQYFSSEKAKRVLKMPQTPIEVGIDQSIEWFKANKYL